MSVTVTISASSRFGVTSPSETEAVEAAADADRGRKWEEDLRKAREVRRSLVGNITEIEIEIKENRGS